MYNVSRSYVSITYLSTQSIQAIQFRERNSVFATARSPTILPFPIILFPVVSVLCLVASVLSLTLIAYDRFFGIVFALKAHMSRRKARFSIGIIWLCSFTIAAPLLWFRTLKERQWLDYTERWCDDVWPVETKTIPGSNFTVEYMPSRTIYFTFVSAVLYFFPMLVMALAYSIIIRTLRSSKIPGERVDAGYTAQQKTKRKVSLIHET